MRQVPDRILPPPVGDLSKLFHFGSGFSDSGFVANRKMCSLSEGQPLLLCSACSPVEMPSIAASSNIFSPIEENSKEFLLVHCTQIVLYQIIFSGMWMNVFCLFYYIY